MKTTIRLSILLLALLVPCSIKGAIIGFYDYDFYAGDNLFQNNLSDLSSNSLSSVLAEVPEGTTVALWNPALRVFGTPSVYSGGAWSIDYLLAPGTGARLSTTSSFSGTFVGFVLNHDGTVFNGEPRFPPPFPGPDGTYLVGDKCPTVSYSTEIFTNIFGRGPNPGEQITRLVASNQTSVTSTYLGGGNWDVTPMLGVGEAAFFKIGSGLPFGNPLLHIYPLGAQQAQLVWSTDFPTCLLYYATNLPATYWLPVTNLPVVNGTNFTVTVNVDLKERYFLLRMP